MSTAQVFILTGSNLGDRAQQLQTAATLLSQQLGNPVKESAIYETAAWGNENQPSFLNQVIQFETAISGSELLNIVLTTEQQMGRVRTQKWTERSIDIDILLAGSSIINEPDLQVPHPYLHQRRFTLVPLNEIAPDMMHPLLKKSINTLLLECTDDLEVKAW
ncbi:MAG: 2-amino-4-hydroxy-6-hydroxymethyldihydropteridine diphosphokinase [Bacteroidia bacterium]